MKEGRNQGQRFKYTNLRKIKYIFKIFKCNFLKVRVAHTFLKYESISDYEDGGKTRMLNNIGGKLYI